MKKYIFVTYGSTRIKGVQTKAINIAKYLPPEEVLIINHGDSSWLKASKLDVYEMNFNVFAQPTDIDTTLASYLSNASIIIYCDFPANMMLSYLIFWYAYYKLHIPIVICDNIYRNHQFKLKTYALFYKLCDMMLLTGVSLFQSYLDGFPKSRLIPPYFSNPQSDTNVYRKKLADSLQIKDISRKNILYVTYNRKAFEIGKKIIQASAKLSANHIIITPFDITENEKNELLTYNSYLITEIIERERMRDFMIGSDIVICKFGYQQLLESLSLGKPTIAVGDSGLKKSWLDTEIQNSFKYYETFNDNLLAHLEKLITDNAYYENSTIRIKKLHNGIFEGGKLSAEFIKQTATKKIREREYIQKKLLVTFNTQENIEKSRKIFKKELFILPIIVTNLFSERDFGYPKGEYPLVKTLDDFSFAEKDNFLNDSFALHISSSPIAYFGFAPVFPFMEDFLSGVEKIVRQSDVIYIVGKEAKSFFHALILKTQKESSVSYIP